MPSTAGGRMGIDAEVKKHEIEKDRNWKDEAMKSKRGLFVVVAVVLAAGALLWTGCDRFSSVDRELSITPSESLYTNDLSWVITFQAGNPVADTNATVATVTNALSYPLEWSVSDPTLGVILSHTGNSAIFRTFSDVTGINIVHCRDQADREGSAVVTLIDPPETNEVPDEVVADIPAVEVPAVEEEDEEAVIEP